MKSLSYLFSIFILITTGCSQERNSEYSSLLNTAEQLLKTDADSAHRLLDSISNPDQLNNKELAHWCMLQGKVIDSLHTLLPAPYYYKQAAEWYSSNGTTQEHAQILLYLGRSCVDDGDYDEAMTAYTNALDVADKNKLDNSAGYINSYMADMYEERAMWTEAINKYKMAAKYFKKTKNSKSYACALRDVGREYAKMDSLSLALTTLSMADSIANTLSNKYVKADITNHLGNVYLLQKDYEKAKKCFHAALKLVTNPIPDNIALIGLYIETDSLSKAKMLIERLPQDNPEYTYSIKYLYYEIYKQEGKYNLALENLEGFAFLTDSLILAENQSKILNIDKKYNDQKNREKIKELKNNRLIQLTISIMCGLVAIIIGLSTLLYRKKTKEKLQKQLIEISNTKNELLNLSLELEKKKTLLSTLNKKGEEYRKLEGEAASLATAYRKLQNKQTVSSEIYKTLVELTNQNKLGSNSSLITVRHWQRIIDEITAIYPTLRSYVFNVYPDISDQEWQYCCFFMYGFDVNTESRLLNINPASVRTKHLRLKEKLKITLPAKTSLYDFLVGKLL